MGKKDKEKKKKGLGAEKTAEKTEKKLKLKSKKDLAAKGEDDIEKIVKQIEAEEKKRKEVKELTVQPPSHRSNFSMTAHPDNPEIVFFGGEYYNGSKTQMFSDLLIYNTKRSSWTQIQSPAGPPPRSAHQAAIVSQGGGQLYIFGGEYTSPTESQFYHHKDLWCYHFSSKRWEKIEAAGGPSGRSGHRMVVFKHFLVVFGGFHDNLRDSKYFNDVYSFDLNNRIWKKLETIGAGPTPRSACQMFLTLDGRKLINPNIISRPEGGRRICRPEGEGMTHTDMFLLSVDKHDETFSKWRWQVVKQVGNRPSMRTGLASALAKDRVFMFGGVQDKEDESEDEESDEEDSGNFFNELYTVQVEGERATWHLVTLTGKKEPTEKKSRRKDKEGVGEEEEVEKMESMVLDGEEEENKQGPTTLTVESGAFTISSTIGTMETGEKSKEGVPVNKDVFTPSPRFSSGLVYKSGILYLFGGIWEDGEKDLTLKDFYSLDSVKLDTWNTIIESDIQSMEWFGSDSKDDEDDDEDEDGMDTD
ncbi:kelch domain-containing protein 4 [Eurytemora carolleeae]|uniref:kelch domain-containing protein 4 n=1 Tax=Eurytemora carolleeae TaxID=1294199 RepID=UPI000C756025|nr:kelch domain-containing protein 4 [Eurytemora carolleeae]|eukprot:XP_023326952.1 kelch domain-containing protein 4-like [Eurytemora affinis]